MKAVRRPIAIALLILAALGGTALAQGVMGAAEARRTFFGLDMEGVHQPSGLRWHECIDRVGKTAYRFGQSVDEGRLTVRNDGALCFSYASTGYRSQACWWIKREGRTNFRFESADGDAGVFVTTAARRANSCASNDTPMS